MLNSSSSGCWANLLIDVFLLSLQSFAICASKFFCPRIPFFSASLQFLSLLPRQIFSCAAVSLFYFVPISFSFSPSQSSLYWSIYVIFYTLSVPSSSSLSSLMPVFFLFSPPPRGSLFPHHHLYLTINSFNPLTLAPTDNQDFTVIHLLLSSPPPQSSDWVIVCCARKRSPRRTVETAAATAVATVAVAAAAATKI